jgi:hypothetical protein
MPTFEIPDGPTTVELKRSGDAKTPGPSTGSIVFNVTNKSTDGCAGRLSVVPTGNAKKEWFAIDGDSERTFAAGETQTATIKITAPKEVAAGDYPFRLRAVAVNDPDNDHAEGPVATAKVPAVDGGHHGGVPWWVWLIIGLVVLIGLGVGGYFIFGGHKEGPPPPPPTQNEVAPAAVTVPKFIDQDVDSIAADAGGYQIIKNETANTGRKPRTVYDQDPKPETPLATGGRVIVSYEPGLVVPDLPANATFASAPNALRSAGLQPGNFLCDRSLSGTGRAPVGTVTAFDPKPGTRVASNSPVNMTAVQAQQCLNILLINPQVFMKLNEAKKLSPSARAAILRPHG